ncbi:hypothetical protein D1953_10870 [Peribacillus asahii]|uniref:Uncharacterized protein n=1 Tax=Peribacillus asahii TaxID=228899 RepID=A0A398B673_9BACI|nr:hypothetical protein [Peribacillus asahii]RID85317.1 hypothetical protein D1953_10870 [Peribacillus asahii]USK59388.1 hypothetical protein LIT37_19810 [Peribacillus asahii]
MKFQYYNDTKRDISIHPGTTLHGCECDTSPIQHGEVRTFILPPGTFPFVKMWDYGEENGLSILVSPIKE